jgi:UDP-N-acetylenolpyruvoylglucosamine reductase
LRGRGLGHSGLVHGARCGIAGLEFLRSIPGTVGGFVRMNGGAYGREVKDILVDCDVVIRSGEIARCRWPSWAMPIAIPS